MDDLVLKSMVVMEFFIWFGFKPLKGFLKTTIHTEGVVYMFWWFEDMLLNPHCLGAVDNCYDFEFRVVLLLGWLPTTGREASLPCYLTHK